MRIMAGVARNLPSIMSPESNPAAVETLPVTRLAPDHFFERRMFTDGVLAMPDGNRIPYWGFEDPVQAPGQKRLPSPMIRMREGETAQVRLEMLKDSALACKLTGAHSRDALRVSTFDTHIYQWKPRSSGTWLYQCHTSTARDFEMGLYGLLIVDPEADAAGRPLAYTRGPAYDREAILVFDDVDPDWHDVTSVRNTPNNTQRSGPNNGPDPVFNPQYFLVNGVANTATLNHPDVAISAKAGEKVLIRMLNASYSLVKVSIEHFHGSIISVDGAAIDTAASPWTSWIPVQPDRPVFMATGSRHDVLIDLDPAQNPTAPGTSYKVTFEFLDLSRRSVRNANAASALHVGRAVTTITVE
jgi:FtsP/CotA-like multicopper oxidase with cupredoxin domain